MTIYRIMVYMRSLINMSSLLLLELSRLDDWFAKTTISNNSNLILYGVALSRRLRVDALVSNVRLLSLFKLHTSALVRPLTIYDRISNSRKMFVPAPDRTLREAPGGIDPTSPSAFLFRPSPLRLSYCLMTSKLSCVEQWSWLNWSIGNQKQSQIPKGRWNDFSPTRFQWPYWEWWGDDGWEDCRRWCTDHEDVDREG